MSLIHAKLVYNYTWIVPLIIRHYPFDITFVEAYQYRWGRWCDERYINEFASNRNINWKKSDIESYSYRINWNVVAKFNEPLFVQCKEWGIDLSKNIYATQNTSSLVKGIEQRSEDALQKEENLESEYMVSAVEELYNNKKEIRYWFENLSIIHWPDIEVKESFFAMDNTDLVWEYVKDAVTESFINFLFDLEFEMLSPDLERELQYQNDVHRAGWDNNETNYLTTSRKLYSWMDPDCKYDEPDEE